MFTTRKVIISTICSKSIPNQTYGRCQKISSVILNEDDSSHALHTVTEPHLKLSIYESQEYNTAHSTDAADTNFSSSTAT